MSSSDARPLDPARVYQERFVPMLFAPWAEEILTRVDAGPGDAVLDVACGTGVITRAAAERSGGDGRIVGLDIAPGMLAVARSVEAPHSGSIEWMEGSALELPFTDGEFDVVTCQHGLQFFPDRLQAVREMCRVLRSGGRAGILVWSDVSRSPLFDLLNQVSARHLGFPAFMAPFSIPSATALAELMTEAGFSDVRVDSVTKAHTYDDPGGFVPMQVRASAAVLTELKHTSPEELRRLIAAIEADVRPALDAMTVDGVLRFEGEANIGVGTATGNGRLHLV